MTVGISFRDLPAVDSPAAALAFAHASGFDAVQFPSLATLSTALDPGELADIALLAQQTDMKIWLDAGKLNPFHLERAVDAMEAGSGNVLGGLHRILGLATEQLGVRRFTIIIGNEADRYDPALPWAEQLQATTDLLLRLAPLLRELGARFLVKTHEEITSHEVRRMVETVGEDVLGVAFDPVNVIIRTEDPVASLRRLEGIIEAVHIDDARICRTGDGFHRCLCDFGAGALDWTSILKSTDANRVVDLHRAEFGIPLFNRQWRDGQPDASCAEVAHLAGLSAPHYSISSSIETRRAAAMRGLGVQPRVAAGPYV